MIKLNRTHKPSLNCWISPKRWVWYCDAEEHKFCANYILGLDISEGDGETVLLQQGWIKFITYADVCEIIVSPETKVNESQFNNLVKILAIVPDGQYLEILRQIRSLNKK